MPKPKDVLWTRARHTEAKHQLLKGYLDAWIGIIGQWADHALLVDGFAGPGEYEDHEPGSPMLMLDAFLRRKNRDDLRPVFHYLFIEADKDRHDHLQGLIARRTLHPKVDVRLVHGDFSVQFPDELRRLQRELREVPPTFAFIDPFGAGDEALHLAADLVTLPRCEALVYVPITFLARFVATRDLQRTLDRLYADRSWERACGLDDIEQRCQLLQDGLIARLRQSCEWVRPFEIVPARGGNSYTLFFGTNNKLGLRRMKDAMWKIDPVGGVRFRDTSTVDHPVLFDTKPDLGRLEAELRGRFADQPFTIEEAIDFTLTDTAFRDNAHLKPTVKRAETAGHLRIVTAKPGRRKGTFPDGTTLVFRPSST